MKLTIEDLKRVIEEEPSLYRDGVNTLSVAPKRPGFKEFEICCNWLSKFKRVKTPQLSSYYLKHVVERLEGTYISNGALIAAAIHLEIPMRFYPTGPNVDIAISKTCPYLRDDRRHQD
jgi:hypothetical protein